MKCFKAYDIRGRLPDELNADIAYRIGRAFARDRRSGQWWSATTCGLTARRWPRRPAAGSPRAAAR